MDDREKSNVYALSAIGLLVIGGLVDIKYAGSPEEREAETVVLVVAIVLGILSYLHNKR